MPLNTTNGEYAATYFGIAGLVVAILAPIVAFSMLFFKIETIKGKNMQ